MATKEDGRFRLRPCPRIDSEVLRMAERKQRQVSSRPLHLDLRGLPRCQPQAAGGFRANVHIQIRGLDQTVVRNLAHDLIRRGLSPASAARGSDLPRVTMAYMLEEIIAGYRQ